ncbi:unnamed protein product [Rangifer tarandus platyrhynchus]|uniref:Uncharacterized protein n=1 Tax=Rangifer tarandus platyrhynchus TaxID=3082113 RepID=A0ABN9A4T9_RANTA|nr:unnamed protein product [Rangifer tarandus platyrhynchus]CAI9181285.1 unnamed protein product [Rangifer tarandus platyrhynchus]CAI9181297.1 unnamed protein product [Rangifer tarandus platyrhynchus]
MANMDSDSTYLLIPVGDHEINPGPMNIQFNSSDIRSKRRCRFDPWVRKISWRRKWQPTQVFLPGEFNGQRILTCYSPRGSKESDTTERLHFTSLLVAVHDDWENHSFD